MQWPLGMCCGLTCVVSLKVKTKQHFTKQKNPIRVLYIAKNHNHIALVGFTVCPVKRPLCFDPWQPLTKHNTIFMKHDISHNRKKHNNIMTFYKIHILEHTARFLRIQLKCHNDLSSENHYFAQLFDQTKPRNSHLESLSAISVWKKHHILRMFNMIWSEEERRGVGRWRRGKKRL